MSAKVIAFLNFKGGVGKTSNVVNIGACLAHHHKKRVLLVDLDAQCNCTYWLVRPSEFDNLTDSSREAASVQRTTYQIFQDAIVGTSLFKMNQAIIKGVPFGQGGMELIPHLHLLPSSVDLFDTEHSITHQIVPTVLPALRNKLKPILKDYDYILLDCPPNLYWVAQAAVLACQHIVVPYNPDFLSLSGLKILCRQLRRLDETLQVQRPHLHRCHVDAIILNRHDQRGKAWGQARADLLGTLIDLREKKIIRDSCLILDPPIRTCVAMAESTSEHLPVILHNSGAISATDYTQLTEQFIKHFEETL